MAYLVLARKYRPRQFSELVGQSHVANTLTNAFKQNKVGQAYLFTGTRGVGKTSAARILAKALRCETPAGPGVPCDKCPSCEEINKGSSLDVLEIDGASNNGVDNVREIRENVKFLPSRGTKKVYIIDEVHMLTGAAFNALLKTLEEPPPHIVFILATTDVQKIPPTILSRCQRFDFRRVPQPVIYDYLSQIAQKEKLDAEPAALRLVARKAEGSIRDSLSLMDQVTALSGTKVTQAKAVEILGVVDGIFLAKLLSSLFQNKVMEALTQMDEAFQAGIEMKQLALDLAESLRNAVLVKMDAKTPLAELTDDERTALTEAVSHTSVESLQAAFRLVSQALEEIVRSPIPRASLEMLLVRLSGLGRLASVEELLARLGSGTTAANASAPVRTTSTTPQPTAPAVATRSSAPFTGEKTWSNFLALVANEKPSLGAVMEHAIPVSQPSEWLDSGLAIIGFRAEQSFYLEQLKLKPNQAVIEAVLEKFVGKKTGLRLQEAKADKVAPAKSVAETKDTQVRETKEAAKEQFLQQDIVKSAQEIFGAKLTSFDINKPKEK